MKTCSLSNWKNLLVFLVFISILFIIGIFSQNISQQGTQIQSDSSSVDVCILISKNYGTERLFEQTISIDPGSTALQVLQQVSNVSTSYGGGFVEAIENISSQYNGGAGEKTDWFYFVNGMLAPQGAQYYMMHNGDVVRWDYHPWDSPRRCTALIGEFPEPFLHGFQGMNKKTTIVYTTDCNDLADEMKNLFIDYNVQSSLVEVSDLTEQEKTNNHLVLIGTYDQHPLIQELNVHAKELGVYIEWDNTFISTFNLQGDLEQHYTHAGVLFATQNFWNPKGNWHGENVIWVVTGVTQTDVKNTVDILREKPEFFTDAVSAIVYDNIVVKVP